MHIPHRSIEPAQRPRIVGLGEVLFDVLPEGAVLGGAPTNALVHAAHLGIAAALVSRVGQDALGQRARAELVQHGVDTRWLQVDPQLPTSTVTIGWDAQQEPQYTIHEPVAWDRLAFEEGLTELLQSAKAVLWGTLACRNTTTCATIEQCLQASRNDAVRFFDVNLRGSAWSAELLQQHARLATAMKLNAQELEIVAAACGVRSSTAAQMLEQLATRYGWEFAVLTQGAAGSLLWADGRARSLPALLVQVVDTIGAGDAFGAALLSARLQGADWERAQLLATKRAALVCSQRGAMPLRS